MLRTPKPSAIGTNIEVFSIQITCRAGAWVMSNASRKISASGLRTALGPRLKDQRFSSEVFERIMLVQAVYLAGLPSTLQVDTTGEVAQESKNIQEPQNHTDHHDGIQDRFNGRCHRDVVIDEPEKNTNHDQNQQDVKLT